MTKSKILPGGATAHEEFAALATSYPYVRFHELTADMLAHERGAPDLGVVFATDGRARHRRSRVPDALPLRVAERRLGLHRSTLASHLRAGNIRAVMFGNRTRIAACEIERVLREGLPPLPGKAAKPRKRRSARRPLANVADAIRRLEV